MVSVWCHQDRHAAVATVADSANGAPACGTGRRFQSPSRLERWHFHARPRRGVCSVTVRLRPRRCNGVPMGSAAPFLPVKPYVREDELSQARRHGVGGWLGLHVDGTNLAQSITSTCPQAAHSEPNTNRLPPGPSIAPGRGSPQFRHVPTWSRPSAARARASETRRPRSRSSSTLTQRPPMYAPP